MVSSHIHRHHTPIFYRAMCLASGGVTSVALWHVGARSVRESSSHIKHGGGPQRWISPSNSPATTHATRAPLLGDKCRAYRSKGGVPLCAHAINNYWSAWRPNSLAGTMHSLPRRKVNNVVRKYVPRCRRRCRGTGELLRLPFT